MNAVISHEAVAFVILVVAGLTPFLTPFPTRGSRDFKRPIRH